ncbi:hypothetical protein KKI24_06360 [bacterium]|nr:hypothetical protein [bacterium]
MMKLQLKENLKDSWDNALVQKLHTDIALEFLKCEDDHAVKASVEFVKFLNHKGLDNQNYPFYMQLFLLKNEAVIHTFLSDGKVLNSLKNLKRNQYLIGLCFDLLKQFSLGSVYEKTLETILLILNLNYRDAVSGFRIYPLSLNELNYISKFLDKNKPQASKINRIILDILADMGDLTTKDTTEPALLEVCARANKIRNVFFDNRTSMAGIIPDSMLVNRIK